MFDLLMFPNVCVPKGHAVVLGRRAYVHPEDYELGQKDPAHLGGLQAIELPEFPLLSVRVPDMIVE